ncbi:MAG TPA: AIR synthase-related protein, partial [Acidimicrobiia bacterium]|nr:AIR synthase-related protein [Acidimicrobiia bacterium]
AGSSVQRLFGELGGKPTAPDPAAAKRSIDLATQLAHRAAVLHDISDGGLAVALAEICIASGVGATVHADHPFNEDPHRFLVVAGAGTLDLPEDLGRKIGSIGGDVITIGDSVVQLEPASDRWHNALPHAVAG